MSDKRSLAIAYSMKRKGKKCASGGTVDSGDPEMNYETGGKVPNPQPSPQPQLVSQTEAEKFRKGANFSEGGEVTCPHCEKKFSHGGQVANDDQPVADFLPNDFDDLSLRDDLEEYYTGKNSGDEIGNKGEDKRRDDVVMRAMAKRRAKKRD